MAKRKNLRIGTNVEIKAHLYYPYYNEEYTGQSGLVIGKEPSYVSEALDIEVKFEDGGRKWYSHHDLRLVKP